MSPTSRCFDPELAPFVDTLPELDLGDVAGARKRLAATTAQLASYEPPVALVIEDRLVRGSVGAPPVAVRVYTPPSTGELRQAVVFMHGGGFVLGDLDTEHGLAAKISATVGALVVSVGYRLAPEHPYPAAVEDCYAVLTWTVEESGQLGIDPGRVAVYGGSAGGGLAAAVALMARDRGGPALRFQFLGMPQLDDRLSTPSMTEFTDTPLWNRQNAIASWAHYLARPAGSANVSPYAAPARAENLSGLPPAYLYACEFDPLRDEGLVYGQRLVQAGVSTELHLYPGTFHGSSLITRAAISRRINADAIAALRLALGPAPAGSKRPARPEPAGGEAAEGPRRRPST